MTAALNKSALDQVFYEAHSAHAFKKSDLTDVQIKEIYDLFKWAPTAFNAQPARLVVVRSAEAKAKLLLTLSPGNVPQVETAAASNVFNTMAVLFNSTANPNMALGPVQDIQISAGKRIRVIRTNKDNQSQDVYSTIFGVEI